MTFLGTPIGVQGDVQHLDSVALKLWQQIGSAAPLQRRGLSWQTTTHVPASYCRTDMLQLPELKTDDPCYLFSGGFPKSSS